jgi:Ni,Fe-hydrogenase III large subunit
MAIQRLLARAEPMPGAPGLHALTLDAPGWLPALGDVAAAGGRLLALWAETPAHADACVRALLCADGNLLLLSLKLPDGHLIFPGAAGLFPAALRMERAIFDMNGLRSSDSDTRPWLRHAAWHAHVHPLRDAELPPAPIEPAADDYAFVRVDGDGVHEIAVGPVHAGIIEPGHFRFSVVGEKVLRLEQHLGYVHKGIERRFTELPILEAHRLAARISGDSAVAYSWAWCQALEACAGVVIPPRAAYLRALALELERIANHLGDLGALGNDAGFAFALSQFGRLKERLLRLTEATLGQRYLMDFVVPGGISRAPDCAALRALAAAMPRMAGEVALLRGILDEHAGVRDRFSGTGMVVPALAALLGLTGLAGRASGRAFDLRVDLPCAPYDGLAARKAGSEIGDVGARVSVRFDELAESCRLVELMAGQIPDGEQRIEIPSPAAGKHAIGCIEGWRGPVVIALKVGADGRAERCHAHDPSWQNWPVLEHAVIGNIVPDFPLINKSFNLSYSGVDL